MLIKDIERATRKVKEQYGDCSFASVRSAYDGIIFDTGQDLCYKYYWMTEKIICYRPSEWRTKWREN